MQPISNHCMPQLIMCTSHHQVQQLPLEWETCLLIFMPYLGGVIWQIILVILVLRDPAFGLWLLCMQLEDGLQGRIRQLGPEFLCCLHRHCFRLLIAVQLQVLP